MQPILCTGQQRQCLFLPRKLSEVKVRPLYKESQLQPFTLYHYMYIIYFPIITLNANNSG
jgi:hypothetical protein